MAKRWYFAKEELENSPSRKCGIDSEKELNYRQQAANLIQDMGQKLKVTQLVINTAIVYMHRFYTFHSFSKFHRNAISACALFLAAKVEEQPRKLEHVIRVSQICIFRENVDIKSEQYQRLASELVYNENLMLRTLGFELNVQHPHTSIVNCCQLVRATKYIAETSYYLATNSLHLSTLCLQYKPTAVACICIYFVCKWSNFQFALSHEGREWWTYVDQTVTKDMLEHAMGECVAIFQKCPQRLKKCLNASKMNNKLPNSPLSKQIEDLRPSAPQYERLGLDDHVKHNMKDSLKVNLLDSRQQSKTLHSQNFTINDHQTKKDATMKTETLNSENLGSRIAAKAAINPQSGQSTTNLVSKENSSFSNLQSNASKNSKESVPFEEKSKSKDSINNNSFYGSFDKMKSNLSVISTNPLSNSAFNESHLDSHSVYSNDTNDLTEFTLAHKNDMMPEFKMEFSDNDDSNPSDNNISLTSTLMMNDSNDSKSLSHAFSNKPNFEISSNYDFKLKPNSFSQFPSQELSNSVKHEKLEQNQTSISTLLSNSDAKSSNQPTVPNNILPNSLLFSNHLATDQYSDFNLKNDSNSISEKIISNNPKSTNILANKKVDISKNNIPTESAALSIPTGYNPIIESITETKPNLTNVPSISAKSLGTKYPHENSISHLNQNSTYNISNTLEPSDQASDLDGSSEHSKRHKKKHKHKEKHKHKDKHKHKHKHKDKDKEKHRDRYNVEQPSFKVVSPNKDQSDKVAPLKLKISKLNATNPENDRTIIEEKKQPLKLKISLSNHQRSSSESPSNTETVSRKRKHDDKGKSGKTKLSKSDQLYPGKLKKT